jgi:hypothetical protein
MAIAALVLGILGTLVAFIPLMFWPALLLSAIALGLGVLGRKTKKGVGTAGIVLASVGLTVGGINYYLMNRAAHAISAALGAPTSEPSASTTPQLTVDAVRLYKDYAANEVSADEVYKGKRLKVTGTVASIDKDFMDNVVIRLQGPSDFQSAAATMRASEKKLAAALTKRAKIALSCNGHGRTLDAPSLEDCTVMQ